MKSFYLCLSVTSLLLTACSAEQEATAPVAATVNSTPAASIEESGITLPEGFTATLFAQGLVTPRHIVVNDNGDVYTTIRSGQAKFRVSPEAGGVMALRDTDGDGVADVSQKFGSADIDTGLALHDGNLYFSSMTTIYTVPLGNELVPTAPIEVAVQEMPQSAAGHRSKVITFDNAGNLYSQVGSPSNSCQTEEAPGSPGLMPCTQLNEYGGIFRYPADGRNLRHADAASRISTGHRNIVALEWNESASSLYMMMHGRDGLNQLWPESFDPQEDIEQPAEEFHKLSEGDNFGWPYTYWDPVRGERMVMPEYGGNGETPDESGLYKAPLIAFPAHWSPNDIVFYNNDQFPVRYQNGAFLAFHGAVVPRRADPGGYNVVFVPMNAQGELTGDWEIFADDFERPAPGADGVGRPSGLAVGPDGDLFIVDDAGGRIWKVSYQGN